MHIPNGLVYHALLIVDDNGIGVRRFHALRPEVGELKLDPLLYVFHLENYSEWIRLPTFQVFPDILDASYRDKFLDFAGLDGFTTLSSGIFWWLINIQPRYLVFRQGNACTIESYMPSWFARQLNMINCILKIEIRAFASVGIYLKVPGQVLQFSWRNWGHLQSSLQDSQLLHESWLLYVVHHCQYGAWFRNKHLV